MIAFPGPRSAAAAKRDLEAPAHAVQFYESETFLMDTVGRFLAAGLLAGERVLVIATGRHREGFLRRLESVGGLAALDSGQLLMLDARDFLARIMVGDAPDGDLFHDLVLRVIASIPTAHGSGRVRAYGEMVDVLWREGNSRAAIRLEELWNEARTVHSFSLLCAYAMGNFYREGDGVRFMEVCHNHSHVSPTEGVTALDDPDARLREICLLQQRAQALQGEVRQREQLELALREALRAGGRVEAELRASVKREREAREQAEASDAFKQLFLGVLGHDLRNPLSSVLTTARLMKVRGDLGPDAVRRLDRIVSSGIRMERMIGEILDVTSARLTEGVPIQRGSQHDLVALASKIAEEHRASHRARVITTEGSGPCLAFVDGARIEQVLSSLVANAIAYGDEARPITIKTEIRGLNVHISVHNFGPPISEATRADLFDPFKREADALGSTKGHGLGLYIAERIVAAHGGTMEVTSSLASGTRFEAIFPVEA